MYDADEIEAINFEQLATPTDRLLLRGNRISKRRPSAPSLVLARGSQPRIATSPVLYDLDLELPTLASRARGSQPRIVATAAVQAREVPSLAPARGSQPHLVAPSVARARGSQPHLVAPSVAPSAAPAPVAPAPVAPGPAAARSRAFALVAVVPALVGIAAGLVAML
ncbi:MAG TPA: hypothetical protein VFT22_40265 [Kofleriaceae bacterium]|nr:hypothetical protein [Kofleriaceae bacterium]